MLDLNRVATLKPRFHRGPSDTFKCKDGWIYAMTIGQPLFVRWCKLMGDDTLATDPRFKDDLARGDNGEALSAIMQKCVRHAHRRRGAGALEANRIPAGPVYTPQQTLDDKARPGSEVLPSDGVSGRQNGRPVLQEPVKLSRTPLTIRRGRPSSANTRNKSCRNWGTIRPLSPSLRPIGSSDRASVGRAVRIRTRSTR